MNLAFLRSAAALLLLSMAGALVGGLAVRLFAEANSGPALVYGNYLGALRAAEAPLVLFSASTCPYCQNAKEYLDERQVAYAVLEIDQSETARQWFKQYDGEGVPMLVNASQALIGFDGRRYGEFLGLAETDASPNASTQHAETLPKSRARQPL